MCNCVEFNNLTLTLYDLHAEAKSHWEDLGVGYSSLVLVGMCCSEILDHTQIPFFQEKVTHSIYQSVFEFKFLKIWLIRLSNFAFCMGSFLYQEANLLTMFVAHSRRVFCMQYPPKKKNKQTKTETDHELEPHSS